MNGASFRRQTPVGPYIADFYSPKHRLIIEIDGDSHFTPDGLEYDAERTAFLEGLGLRVIRFTNAEVKTNLEGVMLAIADALPLSF